MEECAVAVGVAFETAATVCTTTARRITPWSRGHERNTVKRCLSLGPQAGWPRRRRPRAPFGLRVIAGVGSDDKAGLVRGYGACDVINYRSEDLRERIKSITGGEGVDVCFDNVGGTIFEQMARLMKWADG